MNILSKLTPKAEPLMWAAVITAASTGYAQWVQTGAVSWVPLVMPLFAAVMRQFVFSTPGMEKRVGEALNLISLLPAQPVAGTDTATLAREAHDALMSETAPVP